jgi:hypothetical protein
MYELFVWWSHYAVRIITLVPPSCSLHTEPLYFRNIKKCLLTEEPRAYLNTQTYKEDLSIEQESRRSPLQFLCVTLQCTIYSRALTVFIVSHFFETQERYNSKGLHAKALKDTDATRRGKSTCMYCLSIQQIHWLDGWASWQINLKYKK